MSNTLEYSVVSVSYLKKSRLAKFEPKTYEGIFVEYASNSHAYRVLNKSTGCIEETTNVELDEDNGSQDKQIVPIVVGDEAPSQGSWGLVIFFHEIHPKSK